MKKKITSLLTLLVSLILVSCSGENIYLEGILNDALDQVHEEIESVDVIEIDEDGYYTSKEDVALYIHTYNRLPKNFISKKEAINLGWDASQGNLWDVTDKMSIGGDRFFNREKKLPDKEGREYYECDINYQGGYRGPERLVYSNDGLIYYTDDHYKSFTYLYGDE